MSYKIFDAHAHVYPDKIADKAVKAIGDFYGIPMEKDGTVEGLIDACNGCNLPFCIGCFNGEYGQKVEK